MPNYMKMFTRLVSVRHSSQRHRGMLAQFFVSFWFDCMPAVFFMIVLSYVFNPSLEMICFFTAVSCQFEFNWFSSLFILELLHTGHEFGFDIFLDWMQYGIWILLIPPNCAKHQLLTLMLRRNSTFIQNLILTAPFSKRQCLNSRSHRLKFHLRSWGKMLSNSISCYITLAPLFSHVVLSLNKVNKVDFRWFLRNDP